MAGSRLEAAGRAADKAPAQATNCAVTGCPTSCADKWRAIDAETAQAVASADPMERNRKISAAYAGMNLRRPEMQWIGLASIVSRQAGCAMAYADEKAASWNPLVSEPAAVAKQALAETNALIYEDIYPVMRFYEKHGAAMLVSCRRERPTGEPVPEALINATRELDAGRARQASDMIAMYEQTSIVQEQIYSREAYRRTFESNEYWAGNAIGRFFGARPAEIPLSATCSTGNEIPFSGSISSASDRVGYYDSLMNGFVAKPAIWRNDTLTSIAKQGR